MNIQSEIQITRTIGEIKDILDDLACNPDEFDNLKTACQIYQLSQEDACIADNMKSYWINRADRAE